MENAQTYVINNTIIHPKIATRIYKLISNTYYQICNYDKDYLCRDESKDVTQYRSVVKSHPEGQLLSFSLPRKSTLETVTQNIQHIRPPLFINEFIEGPMIQLFYDHRYSLWEIATKNAVGGHYPLSIEIPTATRLKYDSYIRTLFCKAFASDSLRTIPCLEYFSKRHSYHFVLNMDIHQLYMVGVYEINSNENRAIYVPPTQYTHWKSFQNTPLYFPTDYDIPDPIDENTLEDFCIEHRLDGAVIHNTRNASHYVYKSRRLTENNATSHIDSAMFYRFISLKQAHLENPYLEQYPNHKKMFRKFHTLYHNTVTSIYEHYCAFYIRKTLDSMPSKYKYYIEELHHRYYLSSLAKKQRKPITKRLVYEYFATLSPSQQLYACFYERREGKPSFHHPSS
jgi:hypothetical protein